MVKQHRTIFFLKIMVTEMATKQKKSPPHCKSLFAHRTPVHTNTMHTNFYLDKTKFVTDYLPCHGWFEKRLGCNDRLPFWRPTFHPGLQPQNNSLFFGAVNMSAWSTVVLLVIIWQSMRKLRINGRTYVRTDGRMKRRTDV